MISEQTSGKPLHRPLPGGKHDQGVSMDKTLHVTKDATVPTTMETDGPTTQKEHLSDVRALDIEGLSLDIGHDTIVKHEQRVTVLIA